MIHSRGNLIRTLLVVFGLGIGTVAVAGSEVVVYKSPYCGCCAKWVDHMEAAGFSVETREQNDMAAIKAKFGIPNQLASCHTAVVDDRFLVEGHVPADLVQRMIDAGGDTMGLLVPGMPAGSPGMESPNPVSYDVIAVGHDGRTSVYETVEGRSEPR